MTIERHAEIVVPSDALNVSGMIRDILAKESTYRRTRKQDDGMMFITTVKPHWWLLGTAMTILLSPEGEKTKVSAEIKSQPLILGDVFGFYQRYIDSFLSAVAKASEQAAPTGDRR